MSDGDHCDGEADLGLRELATWCHRHRWRVVVGWIVAVVSIIALGRAFGGVYQDNFALPRVESKRAFELLARRFPARAGDSDQIVFRAAAGVGDPAVRARMGGLFARIVRLPHVSGVMSPYDERSRAISRDGTIAFATVQFDRRAHDIPRPVARQIVHDVRTTNGQGLQVEEGGSVARSVERPHMPRSELLGLGAAVVILLVSFGSLIAMGLPILTALFGLGIGLGGLTLVARVFDVPSFAPQLAGMIGLGVGIDYALFIVTRYRQELHGGRDPEAATRLALSTSGRAVVFAGSTVMISLLGMFLMGLSFVRGLAIGAVVAVAMVMLASITLLPAVLGFAGHRIDRLRLRGLHRDESAHRESVWYRWSRQVQRHPWRAALAGAALIGALAVPALSLHLGTSDAGSDPTSLTTRRAYDLLSEGFGPGFNGPLVVAAEIPDGATGSTILGSLAVALRATPGVASATPPQVNRRGDAAVMTLFPTTAPQDVRTQQLVGRLRSSVIPAAVRGTGVSVAVGGTTAVGIDLSTYLGQRLPLFIGVVLTLSFLLLMVVFRSLVVALKAAIMNVLSIGAAYGVVVAVFQWGWLGSIVGIDRRGPIEAFAPMMLFAVLFGLSMDYEVFLLSRMREEYVRTGDNAVAVADGLAATARVITAAAAIMVAIFVSFVLGDNRVIKLFGLGLASAILIDATLVRMLLVPATMELLGDANWWLPRWLDRLLPDLDVEGERAGPPSELLVPPAAEPEREPV